MAEQPLGTRTTSSPAFSRGPVERVPDFAESADHGAAERREEKITARSGQASHLSPLTSHLSPLTSHLSLLTAPLAAQRCWASTRARNRDPRGQTGQLLLLSPRLSGSHTQHLQVRIDLRRREVERLSPGFGERLLV